MGWAYGLHHHDKDKKKIMVQHGGKLVPGAIVDWLDNKGKVHHDRVPVYVKGDKAGYPKPSLHGLLDASRKNFVNGLKEAERARKEYRGAIRRMKKGDPRKYEDVMDAAVDEYFKDKKGKPMKHGGSKGIPYSGIAGKIAKRAMNKAIIAKAKAYDKDGLEEYYQKRKKEIERQRSKMREPAYWMGTPAIYIDNEDDPGHMKLGTIPKKVLEPELRKKLVRGNNNILLDIKHEVKRKKPRVKVSAKD